MRKAAHEAFLGVYEKNGLVFAHIMNTLALDHQVDGEMRGKIVVESEEVKNEMQNFLQNGENNQSGEAADLSQVMIEVRSENQNAQNSDRTPEEAEMLKNLVTRTASVLYEAVDVPQQKGNALYA